MPKKRGVELVDAVEEAAPAPHDPPGRRGRRRVERVEVEAVAGHLGDGVAPFHEQPPERVRIRRAGKTAGQTNDGDRFAIERFGVDCMAPVPSACLNSRSVPVLADSLHESAMARTEGIAFAREIEVITGEQSQPHRTIAEALPSLELNRQRVLIVCAAIDVDRAAQRDRCRQFVSFDGAQVGPQRRQKQRQQIRFAPHGLRNRTVATLQLIEKFQLGQFVQRRSIVRFVRPRRAETNRCDGPRPSASRRRASSNATSAPMLCPKSAYGNASSPGTSGKTAATIASIASSAGSRTRDSRPGNCAATSSTSSGNAGGLAQCRNKGAPPPPPPPT